MGDWDSQEWGQQRDMRLRYCSTSGTRHWGEPHCSRNGCSSRSVALARSRGSRVSMRSRKSLRTGDIWKQRIHLAISMAGTVCTFGLFFFFLSNLKSYTFVRFTYITMLTWRLRFYYAFIKQYLDSFFFIFHTWLTFRTLGAGSSLSLFMAATGVSLKYGGSPSTISTTIIPIDQTSTWIPTKTLSYATTYKHSVDTAWVRSPLLTSTRALKAGPPYLSAIWRFGNDLGSHPIGRPDQRLPLRDVFTDLSAETKVRKLDLWGSTQEKGYSWFYLTVLH